MARCKECLHYEVCAKEGRMVQVDEHTWDEHNKLDDVEQFCTNYFTVQEVATEIFEEIERSTINSNFEFMFVNKKYFAELKKKYTKGSEDKE